MLSQLLEQLQPLTNASGYGETDVERIGDGYEIINHRPYTSQDPADRIDRKVSAKYHQPMLRERNHEANLSCIFCADINTNRRTGIDKPFRQYVKNMRTTVFERAQHHHHELQRYSPAVQTMPTPLRSPARENFDTAWNQYRHQKHNKTYHSHLSDIAKTLQSFDKHVIILVSDFLEIKEETKKVLTTLPEHNTLITFQLPIIPEGKTHTQTTYSRPSHQRTHLHHYIMS